MNNTINLSRRRFFAQTGFGLLAYAGLPGMLQAMQGMGDMPKMPPRKATSNFHADVEINLQCQPATVSILSGQATRVLQYSAQLVKGPAQTLTDIPGSYLGPIIRFETGQKIRINLHNLLDEPSITHWHGLHVPAEVDGHPLYAIDKGQTFVYEFEILNRAGMNIYHPHPHNTTASQVYHGLAGAILVNDAEERRLELPHGEYEVPIVIQDRQFDANNQLLYVRHMRERMLGFYGDRILINGRPDFHLDVASRAYRFRILNGSSARIYKLGWDDNSPVTVIGTDGGLLETPQHKPYVMLAPGERIDVWADFSGRKFGSQLVLRSRDFSGVLPGMAERMMSGGMHGTALPVGSDYPLFSVKVTRQVSDSPVLPQKLSTIKPYRLSDTANPDKPVPIAVSEGPMAMLINGRPYAFNDVQPYERIPVNTVQLLEVFHSQHGGHGMGMMGGMNHGKDSEAQGGMGMMMAMAHPIHLHGQSFQILSRTFSGNTSADYASVKEGFIEHGLKDTVLLMPGERIKIIKPFQDFKGLFMYHCHNLEHEDMGMMRDFSVI
ncbi:multicopper oxidase domain-containing protein [Methylomonas paludis]|uniref:Multicopper oxidase CueO n=1 Tax=Methylomonas paludis TaxID=1173101 RepID=A0A975RA62_9GAMM|nr:multicopper oxidase domain-containing protein [Methylomonas paludis]QWF71807.1 multicopper oxidase domain-containing protein [Methylomonas paludis]